MPNHVTAVLQIRGSESDILWMEDEIFTDGELDFNKIIPMPAVLRDEVNPASSLAEEAQTLIFLRAKRGAPFDNGGMYAHAMERIRADVGMPNQPTNEVAAAWLTKYPEREQWGLNRIRAVLETGYDNWYPWCLAKWGTKWGAYSFTSEGEGDQRNYRFDTAWSFAHPILAEMARRYPQLEMRGWWHDEGDNFAGQGQARPGLPWVYTEYGSAEPEFGQCYAAVHGQTIAERDAEFMREEAEFLAEQGDA